MARLTLLLGLALLLAGCAGSPDGPDAADAVERYLQAKIARDETALRGLLCAEMEDLLDREARTFESVTEVSIEDMSCAADGTDVVRCTGVIRASYGAENTEFPLRSYRVVQEDGEWKWCGEAR